MASCMDLPNENTSSSFGWLPIPSRSSSTTSEAADFGSSFLLWSKCAGIRSCGPQYRAQCSLLHDSLSGECEALLSGI
jgi:hypothetical protein